MTAAPTHPKAWANLLVKAWGPRFPVDVKKIALEYSTHFPDPIKAVEMASVGGFEGALYPLPKLGKWAILYNPSVRSKGRVNFTVAHELGHYLVHRTNFPQGLRCGEAQVLGYDADPVRKGVEQEADTFASYLLMPMDDFRAQTRNTEMCLDLLRHCTDRYGVSFTAAALKWLEFTSECAVLVVATNGFVLWCRRSDEAKRRRIFFPKGMELPRESNAANSRHFDSNAEVSLPPNVWPVPSAAREMAIFADSYEMTISLIVFDPIDRSGLVQPWRIGVNQSHYRTS